MPTERYKDAEVLEHLRCEEGMTYIEMGKELDCHPRTARRYVRKHGLARDKPWRSKEKLYEAYVEQGLSSREIAEKWGCAKCTVLQNMHEKGIDVEPHSSERPPTIRTKNGYVECLHEIGDKQHCVLLHRLLAVAEYGLDEVRGKQVHHKNGIKWDNRPDNIVPVTRQEHEKIHSADGPGLEEGFS